MSVYVDEAENPFGRMKMCHMLADTPQELLDMVRKIGVNPKWFQNDVSCPHFDISKGKREVAIALGAVVVNRRELVDVMHRVRKTWPRDSRGFFTLMPNVRTR